MVFFHACTFEHMRMIANLLRDVWYEDYTWIYMFGIKARL